MAWNVAKSRPEWFPRGYIGEPRVLDDEFEDTNEVRWTLQDQLSYIRAFKSNTERMLLGRKKKRGTGRIPAEHAQTFFELFQSALANFENDSRETEAHLSCYHMLNDIEETNVDESRRRVANAVDLILSQGVWSMTCAGCKDVFFEEEKVFRAGDIGDITKHIHLVTRNLQDRLTSMFDWNYEREFTFSFSRCMYGAEIRI